MPDVIGLDVSKEIHVMDPSATVIVYSRMAGGTVEQQAHALGASDVVDKGGSFRPLGQVLNHVIYHLLKESDSGALDTHEAYFPRRMTIDP